MQLRSLGGTDLAVSIVGLGTAGFGRQVDARGAGGIVSAALDAGINLIDTAEAYPGSEGIVGEALRGRRDRFVLATKFGHPTQATADFPAGSRRGMRRAIEGSLRRLQTDYIDLYYLHWPDPATPLAETLAGLSELIAEGKVRHAGASNFSAEQIAEADGLARGLDAARFVAHQNIYSLLNRGAEADILPAVSARNLGFVAYAPLARGALTGRYRKGGLLPEGARLDALPSDETFARIDALESIAESRSVSLLQFSIGCLLARPGVSSVVIGASRAEQVVANAAALRWTASAEDLAAIDAIAP
jgi:aryl-alcohol dehydrogenase-like predicted oxidoreductase